MGISGALGGGATGGGGGGGGGFVGSPLRAGAGVGRGVGRNAAATPPPQGTPGPVRAVGGVRRPPNKTASTPHGELGARLAGNNAAPPDPWTVRGVTVAQARAGLAAGGPAGAAGGGGGGNGVGVVSPPREPAARELLLLPPLAGAKQAGGHS